MKQNDIKIPLNVILEIQRILNRGNTAEVAVFKHEISVFEKVNKKKITAPVEFRE